MRGISTRSSFVLSALVSLVVNRNPDVGAYMRKNIIAVYYIKIIHKRTQPHMVQWSITASEEAILTNGPGFESGDSQLEFEVWHDQIVLFL